MSITHEFQQALDRAWQVQDYAFGRELIEQALQRDAKDSYLRVCHITALGFCSRFQSAQDETARLFAEISRGERRKWSADLAAMWNELGRHDIALPLAREVLHDPLAPARMLEIAANCLEQLRRPEEALEIIGMGLRRFPGHPGLSLVKARVLRLGQQWEEAARVLDGILRSPQTAEPAKIGAGYELGHVHDAQGRHAEAYEAFCQAKRLQLQSAQGLLAKWQRNTRVLVKQEHLPTRDDFTRWQDASANLRDPAQRLAFLVGCPRSGTTLLERMLDSHPGLAATPETLTLKAEVWCPLSYELTAKAATALTVLDKLRALSPQQIHSARRLYWDLVPDALEAPVDGRVILDKNPSLFPSLPTLARLFPDADILVALRDPRAIAWSCFTQHLPVNPESVAFLDLETTCRHLAARLDYWRALRTRLTNRWREVHYEALVQDPAGEAARTLEFLGLPWDEQVLHYHERRAYVRSPSYAQASRPVYQESLEKWRPYEEHLRPHLAILQPAMS